ncbi:unnamed protein product [Brassicogethes aeneus]|uniref:TRUD domain-containing protein n=1 Tax=Brassicogethes aeneus TaxID=1431903 RepID=A0A9P0ASX0_BRAAE|nr:unnamed protein product [Brassicogethes aeneus]
MSGRFGHKKNFKRNNKWQGKPHNDNRGGGKKEYRHVDQLTEKEVGITEYLSDLDGFTGILKARFSDFQVNEIDLEGNVAKLTNTDIPKDFHPKVENVNYKEVVESPHEKISKETWEEIKNIMDNPEKTLVKIGADELTKEERKSIHACMKTHFGQKIIASTLNKDDKKFLEFRRSTNNDRNQRQQWPEDKGEYVHFILYKECMDTMDACIKISDCVRMATHTFNYAGVKDKRAKTTQWFSAKKVEPWKLIIKTKNLRNVKIGNITFKDHPLRLGDLSGNTFRIALRNVEGEDELINKNMQFVKENGFINYYGLQRFGNDKEVPTFDIGIKLMHGKWEEAVKLILKSKKYDDPHLDISKAKKVYSETGDALKAFKELNVSENNCIEAKLLEGLSKEAANDYVNALEKIPRNMRLLYIHAFQSLIWNRIVSKRIKEFGLKPIEGDLIIINEQKESKDNNDDEEIKCKQEVRALKFDELESFNIFDIVLPLPGYDVVYPEYLKNAYKEALEEFELSLEMPKQKVKTYTLSGTYRNILTQPKYLTWKILNYNDPNYNLILSDFEQLKKVPEPVSLENGKFKALVMEFTLHSSSYATMVIREIMKIDTSTSSHAKLNNYFDKGDKKIDIAEEAPKSNADYSEIMKESSLLKDKEKYEEFKNSIFKAICPTEKESEELEEGETPAKKAKVEEKDSGIKMEASLV